MSVQIGRMVCVALAEGATVTALFLIGQRDEEWSLIVSRKGKILVAVLCVVQAVGIGGQQGRRFPVQCLLGIFAGCLLAACIMDLWECMIYRFVWWVGGVVAAGLWFLNVLGDGGLWMRGLSLMLFIVLQYRLFGRMYGRADCAAFCICAVIFSALGGEFADYVIHMAVTFGILALVQGFRRNIASNGNLKKPVPLMPYITVAFWFWVDFMG